MGRTNAQYKATEGLNRVGTAIKSVTSSFTSGSTTGDISQGQVVEVTMPGSTSTPVVTALTGKSTYTGAVLIQLDTDGAVPPTGNNPGEFAWVIQQNAAGDNLYVWGNGTHSPGTLKFWVF